MEKVVAGLLPMTLEQLLRPLLQSQVQSFSTIVRGGKKGKSSSSTALIVDASSALATRRPYASLTLVSASPLITMTQTSKQGPKGTLSSHLSPFQVLSEKQFEKASL